MVNAIIDGIKVSVPKDTSIMEAAEIAGIKIPKLCFLKDVNEIASCRICVVEVEGIERVVSSCNNIIEEGMVVRTDTPKVRSARKTNLQLILSQHDSNCPTCVRNDNCALQDLTKDMGLLDAPYKKELEISEWDQKFPILRNASKCIKCMRCVNVCEKVQNLGVWDIANTGYRTTISVKGNKTIKESNCAICGQCVTNCPVGALSVRDDRDIVYEAIQNPEITTVVQIAPAIRAAFCESLGLPSGSLTAKKLVAALKKVGFDYVFDTDFTADLTIMEEGSELIEKLTNKEKYQWPMFTSCCPGWVRFLKSEYPDMVPQLSTAKSPQQMFGAVAKTYFAEKIGVEPSKMFVVSIMPCSAKKYECDVEGMDVTNTGKDVDIVMTTREMMRYMQMANVNVEELEEKEFDSPLGESTGAGVIFGASGGVLEAALRSAYYLLKGENIQADAFKEVRGFKDRRELEVEVDGITVRCAVVSSLGKARDLIEDIKAGRAKYDFVEVMACPGGCVGGGGQPIKDGCVMAYDRAETLYDLDKNAEIRYSHENPEVQILYKEYLEKPLSHKSHELLHTDQTKWNR